MTPDPIPSDVPPKLSRQQRRRLERERAKTVLRQPYVELVYAAAAAANERGLLRPGTVNDVWVLHDEWCPLLNDTGLCRCDPSVHVVDPAAPDGVDVTAPGHVEGASRSGSVLWVFPSLDDDDEGADR